MTKHKENRILFLIEKVEDFIPIARAVSGILYTHSSVNYDEPEHQFFPDTGRFWVKVDALIPGWKAKHNSIITVAVVGETYDMAYHGWLQLIEYIKKFRTERE